MNDVPYTYTISTEYYDELINLTEQYDKKAFKETVLVDNFNKIAFMISKTMGIDEIAASLLLIQDCLIQKEDLRKDHIIFKHELYRDGIEVMEYFFDILNYIAGYHEKQLRIEELRDVDSPPPAFPHVVLALESVQELFNMRDAERRPLDYLHRIMLRLYVYLYVNILE